MTEIWVKSGQIVGGVWVGFVWNMGKIKYECKWVKYGLSIGKIWVKYRWNMGKI